MHSGRPHWSYSALTQYLRCPLQYFFQRVIGIPSRATSSGLALGSAVHSGLAEYHRGIMEGEPSTRDDVLKAFHECWKEKEAKETIQFRDGDTRADSLGQGVHLLEMYLSEPPPTGIVAVEQSFLVPLYNSLGEYLETPLLAVTDLITASDQSLTVNEFKTSGRAYSESEVQTSLQPTCYVHAVREGFGTEPNVQYTVLVKTKTPKVQRLRTSRFEEDCARLGDVVESVQRAVDLGIFYPNENPMNCSSCSYRGQCREWNRSAPRESSPHIAHTEPEMLACSPS